MKKIKNMNGVLVHLIITAVLGIVFWVIGEVLFPVLTEKMWTPLGIAIYFLIFAVLIMITFFIISATKIDLAKKEIKRNIKDGYAIGAIAMVGVILFSCLFEFLYELGGQEVYEPTSYIFLVDDSGSMEGTEDIRINAIKEVMENSAVKKPYAVYKFADNAEQIKPMGHYNNSDRDNFVFESNGGTEILRSIVTVLEDLKSGKLNNAGNAPKILLLSDGGSSKFGLRSVARKCKDSGVSVSTIGVEGCVESFLQSIADKTGGVFVRCDDVTQLSESFEQAKAMNTDRNLLSERFVYKNDQLYAFLRILFLGLLGIVWSFFKSFIMYDNNNQSKKNIIFSIICCIIGVLIIEFLSGTIFNIKFLRLIFCVFWALTYNTVAFEKKVSEAKYGVAEKIQTGGAGSDSDLNSSLLSEKRNASSTKELSFGGTNNDPGNQTGNPVADPFAGQSVFPNGNSSGSNNGGFVQNPFGGNTPSSPFGNNLSNPFNNNSSSSNPFSDNSSSNPFSK